MAARRERMEQPRTEAVRQDVLMPVMSAINTRIHVYEQRVEEWREAERRPVNLPKEKLNRIDGCRSHLQHILIEYTALQKQLQQEPQIEAAQLLAGNSLLQLNQQDIDYLESGCSALLAELQGAAGTSVVASPDPQIKAAFDNGDYSQVINLYGQTVTASGQFPADETVFQYGQALLKNRQEAESLKVLNELLNRMRQQQGQDELLLRLLQSVADLSFGMEAYDEARGHYEELIRLSIEREAQRDEWAGLQLAALMPTGALPLVEMKAYTSLLKNYLTYVPKRDSYNVTERADTFLQIYPASLLTPNVHMMKKAVKQQSDHFIHQEIARVKAQTDGQGSAQSQVSGTGQVIDDGEASGRDPATAGGGNALQEEYERGMAALQAKEYDKAIACFNRLQGTPLEGKARPQIEETSRLAAQDLRQKAADLFIRANGSRDAGEKRKLLLTARDLLQSILVRYPKSGLGDKVQNNLDRIEEHLRLIDGAS